MLNLAPLDDARPAEMEGDFDSFAVDPKQYAQLRRFRCGDGRERSQREVNKLVREYGSGRHKGGTFRVTVQRRRLIGVAAFETATASQPLLGRYAGSPYISVLALSERYRGRRKAGRRLGDFVLQDVLRAIDERWGGTPNVFALVNPTNSPSRNLFERNGFRMIVAAEPNNHESDALFRRGGQQVPSGRMPVEAMPTSRL